MNTVKVINYNTSMNSRCIDIINYFKILYVHIWLRFHNTEFGMFNGISSQLYFKLNIVLIIIYVNSVSIIKEILDELCKVLYHIILLFRKYGV